MAAYTAKKMGHTVLLIEPGNHLGGLSSSGLGATDSGKKESITGLSRDFYHRLGQKYNQEIAWHFEPHVAEEVFNDYIREAGVEVIYQYSVIKASKKKNRLKTITLKDYENGRTDLIIEAEVFIDCSYEGDLLGKSGVSYTIGREPNEQYGETYNGVQVADDNQIPEGIDPYLIPGDSTSGLLWGINPRNIEPEGTGDQKLQAYCYRLCMTTDTSNMLPITRPVGYDPSQYELLRRIIQTRDSLEWIQRIHQLYLRIIEMPNQKVDINNKGGFSLDMIGENHNYIEANYQQRKEIEKKHELYNKGIIYFLSHDPHIPDHVKEQMKRYGWPKDEFTDNDHFPHQIYVREGRRMVSDFVMTEHHCMGRDSVPDAVAMGSYQMDSHNCDRHVINGMAVNEGDVQVKVPGPYGISYRSIIPKKHECINLLVPVCLSASHIAYGSIRMEPVFMMLGQSAGYAAALAVDGDLPVQDISIEKVVKNKHVIF